MKQTLLMYFIFSKIASNVSASIVSNCGHANIHIYTYLGIYSYATLLLSCKLLYILGKSMPLIWKKLFFDAEVTEDLILGLEPKKICSSEQNSDNLLQLMFS